MGKVGGRRLLFVQWVGSASAGGGGGGDGVR